MPLRKFLKQSELKENRLLPKPTASEVASANKAVMEVSASSSSSSSKRNISVIKPKHAVWLMEVLTKLKELL